MHLNKARERWNEKGENEQRPSYWQWCWSFILGDSIGYPVEMYLSPNWMLSRVRSVKHFFQNALSRARCGVLVPTSLWLGPIYSLPFATVVFWLHLLFFKGKAWKENSFVNFSLQPTATHTRHALKLICQTTFDSTLFKSLLSHAGQLSCRDVTEVTWPKPRIFSCSKRRVCFHSNQYFYIPQKKISIYQTNSVYVKLYLYSTK